MLLYRNAISDEYGTLKNIRYREITGKCFIIVKIINMKNSCIFLFSALFSMFTYSCKDNHVRTDGKGMEIKPGDAVAELNLTVAQGKRLIARGVARHPYVREKMSSGMIIITRGTTNTYIAEELAGLDAPRGSFMLGNMSPVSVGDPAEGVAKHPDVILVDGKRADIGLEEALKLLKEGDIVFKGGNMLDYENRQVAVCVGSPTGGTVGKIEPYVGDGKATLFIPIGLEKQVYGDLKEYEDALDGKVKRLNGVPRLYVYRTGIVFTEIEAIRQFADVGVFPLASGGIAGREGGISLVVYGPEGEVSKILDEVKSLENEPAFL